MIVFILQKYREFAETWKKKRAEIMGTTRNINAVYEDDMDSFLSSLGILSDLENKILNCYYCDTNITKKNFFACFPVHATIAVCCDQPNCKMKLMEDSSI